MRNVRTGNKDLFISSSHVNTRSQEAAPAAAVAARVSSFKTGTNRFDSSIKSKQYLFITAHNHEIHRDKSSIICPHKSSLNSNRYLIDASRSRKHSTSRSSNFT